MKKQTLTPNFETTTENEMALSSLEKIEDGVISKYKLRLSFKEEASPKPYTIIWDEDLVDILGFWSSLSSFQRNVSPDWWMRKATSRLASGTPHITLFNKSDKNRISVTLSDPLTPTTIMAGIVEETGRVRIKIELFSNLCAKMKDYEVIIRIDRREIAVEDAVSDAKKWWDELGFKGAHVPEHATLPMYSCWYSFHQRTIADEIVAECERAKALGMDTVIVDDGWQTDDNSRGYAFCGDWKIATAKIPDMKDFVDRVHALGMKFMVWFSVPFVGISSENFERFKGKYLCTSKGSKACVLDPRFKEVREFLVDIYASYVKEYGWDGLKLDFIDSFRLTEESSTDYDSMDFVGLEEAVDALMSEVYEALTKINPEILIEFRQSYIGPVVGKYGNMFRVGDCPGDALTNKTHSLDLRISSGNTAVHSDMLVFNENDTLEGVAYQLYAIMFCVPQISVLLDKITEEQRALLTYFLSFWREHRKTLLDGKLSLSGYDVGYTMAQSTRDGECVAVLYHNVAYSAQKDTTTYLFNPSGYDGVVVELEADAECEIYDILGNKYTTKHLCAGIHKIPAKNCEMIKLS